MLYCLLTLYRFSPIILLGTCPNNERRRAALINDRNKYAGTQTEQNLWEAFAGESQARNKYSFFASVAKKQGFEQIAALFLKTAENEKAHAKLWLK